MLFAKNHKTKNLRVNFDEEWLSATRRRSDLRRVGAIGRYSQNLPKKKRECSAGEHSLLKGEIT